MLKKVTVPDIGSYSNVDIIEVLVKEGDKVEKESSLITLETEKATMEIPSPYSGVIKSIDVKTGDKVSQGSQILTMETEEQGSEKEEPKESKEKTEGKEESKSKESSKEESIEKKEDKEETKTKETSKEASKEDKKEGKEESKPKETEGSKTDVHAGPSTRRLARELGVDLSKVSGTGRKDRIMQSDVKAFVKKIFTEGTTGTGSTGAGISGLSIAPWPQIDHAKFGEIVVEPISRIKKLSGSFLHRNWVMVPHVTQFDEADITELEAFRKEQLDLAAQEGIKLTPLVFLMKAVTTALKNFPSFNASLDETATKLILKKYVHIGVAVDTPNGLVVPVVREVDKKGLFQLAKELGELSEKARKGQLTALEMQGSSFSISSLGGIGGTYFTPIVNVPDVAILGVSRSQIKPIYIEGEFKPRLMLPLSLSYDHRVVDGAEAARFTTFLVKQLSDIRRILL